MGLSTKEQLAILEKTRAKIIEDAKKTGQGPGWAVNQAKQFPNATAQEVAKWSVGSGDGNRGPVPAGYQTTSSGGTGVAYNQQGVAVAAGNAGPSQAEISAYNTALANAQKLGQESNERARTAFATQNELAKQQNTQNLEVAKQATQSSATSSTGGGSTKSTAVTGVGNQGVGAAAFQTMRAANQNEFNSGANRFALPDIQKIFFGGT